MSDEDGRGVIRYRDNDERVPRGPSQRPCPKCGKLPTPEGHDPCIANLPGVANACCGHGGAGYIAFTDGRIISWPRAEVEDELPVIKAVRAKLRKLDGDA